MVAAVVGSLMDKKSPTNPYLSPARPRAMSEAEQAHEDQKAWRLFDTVMEQSFGRG